MPESLEHLVKVHGEPSDTTFMQPRKHGARKSLGAFPAYPPRIYKKLWHCGLVAACEFRGVYRQVEPCRDKAHIDEGT